MKAHSKLAAPGELAEVIDTAAGTGGLVHVCVFLAKAFEQAPPALGARADLRKCAGAGLAACSTCVRVLSPVGAGQRWAEPQIAGKGCSMHASADRYGHLYVHPVVQTATDCEGT